MLKDAAKPFGEGFDAATVGRLDVALKKAMEATKAPAMTAAVGVPGRGLGSATRVLEGTGMIGAYNAQVDAYHRLKKKPARVEDFVDYGSGKIAWSELLKKELVRGTRAEFDQDKIRRSLYRPFTSTWLYFDQTMTERRYGFPEIFPKPSTKNLSLCVTDAAGRSPFSILVSDRIVDLHFAASTDTFQCFPLHIYSEDGKERRDNITAKALTLFQIFYGDAAITRADLFHYVYALLHHPAYRARYAENLKRELPRIPFVGVAADVSPRHSATGKRAKRSAPTDIGGYAPRFFPLSSVTTMQGDTQPDHDLKASAKLFHAFAAAGKQLADLHVGYESAKEFPLKRVESKDLPLDWRVEAMKLTRDKTAIVYNDFLTLAGVPPEVFGYRLGNRSALDWVIDQYRIARDEHGQVVNDPNRLDDEEYIVRLLGQVITVSLETQKLVRSLPEIGFA